MLPTEQLKLRRWGLNALLNGTWWNFLKEKQDPFNLLHQVDFLVWHLNHNFWPKASAPCFDFRFNTLDVNKTWLHPSSPFQTSFLFLQPSLPQPPPHPSCSLSSCLIPLLTFPPWYSHYIPTGHSQSLWNAGGIPRITGGWLADWLLLGIGNKLSSSWGKQLLSRFSLHLSLAFFIREMKVQVNKWTDRGKTGTVILASIILPLLPIWLLSGLRKKWWNIITLRGVNLFCFCYSHRTKENSLSVSSLLAFKPYVYQDGFFYHWTKGENNPCFTPAVHYSD